MNPETPNLRSPQGFVPLTVTPRGGVSPTLIGHQTFAGKNFDPFWGIDFFSSAGTLSSQEQIAGSTAIERVFAERRFDGTESMTAVARMLAASLPRNRPILNLALESLPPLRPAVGLSLVIPVAATQEERAIPRLLETLKKQMMDRDHWEALLFLNVASRPGSDGVLLDRTDEIVREFEARNPEINLLALRVHYSTPQPIGAIRHDGACAVLARHLARWPRGAADHLLLMSDADTRDAKPEWLETIYKASFRHPETVAIRGPSRWDRPGLASHPLPLLLSTAGEAISMYLRARFPRAGEECPTGPNLAVRASAFAKVGYGPSTTLAEDLELVRNLSEIGRVVSIGARGGIKTSSRRLLEAAKHGIPPDRQWGSFTATAFGEDNSAIRARADEGLASREAFTQLLDTGLPDKARLQGLLLRKVLNSLIEERINFEERLPRVNPDLMDEVVRDVLVERLALPVRFSHDLNSIVITDLATLRTVLLAWRDSIASSLAGGAEGS